MNIVELAPNASETMQIAWGGQRDFLAQEGVDLLTISSGRKTMTQLSQEVQEVVAKEKSSVLWVRGFDLLNAVFRTDAHRMTRIVVDHCIASAIDPNHPLMGQLHRLNHVICYGTKVEANYRRGGFGKVKVMGGPYLPPGCKYRAPEGDLTVAVLRTCYAARDVLVKIVQLNRDKGWGAKIVSSMSANGVTTVNTDFEAAERAQLVIAPFEEEDVGVPHEGAMLALGVGRALATSRTMAMDSMPYPSSAFILCPRYAVGAYAAAIPTFQKNPTPFAEWSGKAKTDYTEIPRTIMGWASA